LKINLFTPVRQLAESKLILAAPSSYRSADTRFFAPLGAGVHEENQWNTVYSQIILICRNTMINNLYRLTKRNPVKIDG
jgi:hypothetical protein